MPVMLSRAALVALVACAAACGSLDDASSPDAAQPPDAPGIDAPETDASPDGPAKLDADHDGHPADADCDDGDPLVWRELPYSFRDADGDGRSRPVSGTICSGTSLPPGYFAAPLPGGTDCDDADPAVSSAVAGYVDIDGDGVGDGSPMSFCTAGGLPPGSAATRGDCAPADPARWIGRPYSFRDADGDGAAVAEAGMVCSGAMLPPGCLDAAPPGVPLDCDDTDPAVSVVLSLFADLDLDGFGAGPVQLVCTSGAPPAGYSTTGTDCADDDGAVWVARPYAAVDLDGDGVTVAAQGTRCTAGVLLPPYYPAPMGNDCDDANSAVSVALTVYADLDGDGFGAGPALLACTSGSPPSGFSLLGTDCDDGNAARWALLTYKGIDADEDGVTVSANGQLCTDGTLPPPYKAAASGNDCDDTDPALTHNAVLYPDQDGDGIGAPPRQILCLGNVSPAGLSHGGYDDDDGDPAVIEDDDEDELLHLILLGP
jgi:hypothetical protein